jgi:hypothetical protein
MQVWIPLSGYWLSISKHAFSGPTLLKPSKAEFGETANKRASVVQEGKVSHLVHISSESSAKYVRVMH